MSETELFPGYNDHGYEDAAPCHVHRILLPAIIELAGSPAGGRRVLDVGCGNGALAGPLLDHGFEVTGIDLGASGIQVARRQFPRARFEVMAINQRTLENLDAPPFDIVVSTEVIEHVYAPHDFARGIHAVLKPGGRFVCSTPYHGWLKNVAIAASGKFDWHCNPLWESGHIKFWSRETLSQLLADAGFVRLQFRGVGRLPWLWMSMVMSGDKPAAG